MKKMIDQFNEMKETRRVKQALIKPPKSPQELRELRNQLATQNKYKMGAK